MIKITTIFERDLSTKGHPVKPGVKPDCEWVERGEGRATRKYDGVNIKIENGLLYKRRELKTGGYDIVGYVKCEVSNPSDRYLFDAFFGANEHPADGIYEAIGPKIQGNPEQVDHHQLIPIPPVESLTGVPRDFDGMRGYLRTHNIEGIVFHHDDGRMAKIKKRDFGFKRRLFRSVCHG